MGQSKRGPPKASNEWPSKKLAASSALRPTEPMSWKRGRRSALATPIRALCAATCRSARSTSGRRRSRSAGIPTAMATGAAGMPLEVPRRSPRSPGGTPSRTQSESSAWRRWISSCGMLASVSASSVRACCTSSSDVPPASNRTVAISRLSRWTRTFSCASAMRSSRTRICTYVVATSATRLTSTSS